MIVAYHLTHIPRLTSASCPPVINDILDFVWYSLKHQGAIQTIRKLSPDSLIFSCHTALFETERLGTSIKLTGSRDVYCVAKRIETPLATDVMGAKQPKRYEEIQKSFANGHPA
jgi:hypothetical protein